MSEDEKRREKEAKAREFVKKVLDEELAAREKAEAERRAKEEEERRAKEEAEDEDEFSILGL